MSRIHNLNARGNLLLAAMRQHYSWTDARTFNEIQRLHQDFLQILSDKGVSYDELRTALTPQTSKHEAAFLFDEHRCNPERIAVVTDIASLNAAVSEATMALAEFRGRYQLQRVHFFIKAPAQRSRAHPALRLERGTYIPTVQLT